MKNPVERIRETLIGGDPQKAVMVNSERNRRYFTGFPSDAGALLVTAEEAYLLQDFRYEEAAGYSAKNCTVVGFTDFKEKLCELLEKHGVKQVYMEINKLSVAEARTFEKLFQEHGIEAVLDETLDKAIKDQRMIKSPEEVRKIEDAQAITDAAFQHILPFIKEGVTERELALEIEFFMRNNGAEAVAFELIVAAGKSGSQCHAVPGANTVQKGDFITMDFGCIYGGYCSDMTRTIAIGSVSDDQRKVYETVLAAQKAGIAVSKAGVPGSEIHNTAAKVIADAGYGRFFGHGYGHSLGLEIHETPNARPNDHTPMPLGAMVSAEPGIYIPGQFGVRIEDVVRMEKDGVTDITKSPKELIIL